MKKALFVLTACLLVFSFAACGQKIEVPEYEVLDSVELFAGGVYGDILITGLTPESPKEEIKQIIQAIEDKEGFDALALYSTNDAYEAAYSQSFSDSHPDAYDNGFIAQHMNGEYIFADSF